MPMIVVSTMGMRDAAPGICTVRMIRPMMMKAICAIISTVTSTTVEAKATALPTPLRIAARAPITMPPICEKGSTSPAESRTARPQQKVTAERLE